MDVDTQLEARMKSLRKEMLRREDTKALFFDYPANRHKVVDSELYGIIKSMPKGGLQHTHSGSTFSLQYALDLALALPETRIYFSEDGQEEFGRIMFLPQMDKETISKEGWKSVESVKNEVGDVKSFLTDLYTFSKTDSKNIWAEFEKIFARTMSLYCYLPVFEPLYIYSCRQMISEGITYFDYRTLLYDVFRSDGTKLTDKEKVQKLIDLTSEVKKECSEFNMHIIYCGVKSFSPTLLQESLKKARQLMDEFPDVVKGYDLVGEEKLVNQLSKDYDLLEKVNVPYYFHAGEHTLNINTNIETAVRLGTKRIGHGFNLYQFPEQLMDEIRDKGITLEVCPISNQVLGYCDDLREHPVKYYIKKGLKVTISSDDHELFQTSYLTDDLFIAYLAWGLSLKEFQQLINNTL